MENLFVDIQMDNSSYCKRMNKTMEDMLQLFVRIAKTLDYSDTSLSLYIYIYIYTVFGL